MTLKLALIGAGAAAVQHARGIDRTRGTELVGFYARDPDARARHEDLWGVEGDASLAELLARPEVDAVIVTTHVDSHVEYSKAALVAGKHVLIEKPVAETAEEIRAVAALAASSRLVAAPVHNYAYLPEARRVIETARSGRLGDIRAAFVTYAIAHPEELAAHYGDVLTEVMTHHAYLALAALGQPSSLVAGESVPGWKTVTSSDQGWMTWTYERPGRPTTTAHLFASFAVDDFSDSPQTLSMKLLGTLGTSSFTWRSTTGAPGTGPFSIGLSLYDESFDHQIAAFRDAINGDDSAILSSLDDAAVVAELIQLAVHSAGRLAGGHGDAFSVGR